ncbi:uncharacterized protein ATC70_004369 [Mucor velutinosus]|uniref:RNA binding n=1 Tax=Mucor velutinosus TaxID=708070 RepID=A0AAN7DIX5_9FUNG|nr:RNA binding [Mucor velutinosus]KAK4521832.1 hypothetical protein ATC70_004369 [Mucor velutinosus]
MRYTPTAKQDTDDLRKLFNDVSKLVRNYADQHQEQNDDIACLVAGHLVKENMADFTIKVAPASRKRKAISGYDMFKQEMMLQTSEVSSTASTGKPNDLQNLMAKYAEAWKALKKNNPDKVNQLKLKAAEKTKARDAEPITTGGRLEVYHNDLNTITKSLVAMRDKYNFHAVLYHYTETDNDFMYPSDIFFNSKIASDNVDSVHKVLGHSLDLSLLKTFMKTTSEASSVPSSPTAGSPVQEDSALGVHADRVERLPGLPASQMEPLLSNLLPNGNAPARSALASTSATVFDNDKESLLKAEYLKGIREMATQMTSALRYSQVPWTDLLKNKHGELHLVNWPEYKHPDTEVETSPFHELTGMANLDNLSFWYIKLVYEGMKNGPIAIVRRHQ